MTLLDRQEQLAAPAAPDRQRLRGRSVLLAARVAAVVALYALYAHARNTHGRASEAAWRTAQAHADALVALQTALHLPPERDLQQLVLGSEALVRVSGAYYGSAHFLGTAGVLALLVLRGGRVLNRLGATLGLSTFVAVTVFVLYPVAPPRLMPPGTATVDTLATVGGVWSYDHGVLERISDPFAAMPSLHLAWATWCGLALWALARSARRPRAWQAAAVAHPVLTLVSVLVTGNHWYVDAVAGVLLVLVVAWLQAAARTVVLGNVGPRTYARDHERGRRRGAGLRAGAARRAVPHARRARLPLLRARQPDGR